MNMCLKEEFLLLGTVSLGAASHGRASLGTARHRLDGTKESEEKKHHSWMRFIFE